MGTNYYAHIYTGNFIVQHIKTQIGARAEYELHIGKASCGWTFSFHSEEEIPGVIPEIKSWVGWQNILKEKHVFIKNEYDEVVSFQEFFDMVESKKTEKFNHTLKHADEYSPYASCPFLDEEGNSFSPGYFS